MTNTLSWIFIVKQQSTDRHMAPLGTHYPDSEPINICSFSLMLRA